MEQEFTSGEEFLKSIQARLARMEEMSNAFHNNYQTDIFKRELEEKQLRASIAKTNACCNTSQNNGSTENDEMAKLLKIYDPDRETELADVFRYREYSEELETIEEMNVKYDACDKEFVPKYGTEYLEWLREKPLYIEETNKRNDDQVESSQRFAVDFENGTQYLQWLKLQLPHVEPFQSRDETHYYFFRKWRKDDLKYHSGMECLDEMENEDNEDETDVNVDVSGLNISELEPFNEENKPEFDSGRQLVEWLGRRLTYLEPFAPSDAVHYYFKRTWSREKFVASLDVLEEVENVEEPAKEQVHVASHIKSNQNSSEDEEDINVYISLMSRPMVLDGFKLQEKTENPDYDKPLPVEVNERIVNERKVQDEMPAPGPIMKPMKTENEPTGDQIIKTHQNKRRNFLRRLFGR